MSIQRCKCQTLNPTHGSHRRALMRCRNSSVLSSQSARFLPAGRLCERQPLTPTDRATCANRPVSSSRAPLPPPLGHGGTRLALGGVRFRSKFRDLGQAAKVRVVQTFAKDFGFKIEDARCGPTNSSLTRSRKAEMIGFNFKWQGATNSATCAAHTIQVQ